jgi:hypothetical protein
MQMNLQEAHLTRQGGTVGIRAGVQMLTLIHDYFCTAALSRGQACRRFCSAALSRGQACRRWYKTSLTALQEARHTDVRHLWPKNSLCSLSKGAAPSTTHLSHLHASHNCSTCACRQQTVALVSAVLEASEESKSNRKNTVPNKTASEEGPHHE